MSTFTTNTESKTDSSTTKTQTASPTGYAEEVKVATEGAKTDAVESTVDDFGYEIALSDKAKEDKKFPTPPGATEKTDEEKAVEKKATGYGDEPEAKAEDDKSKVAEEKKDDPETTDEEKIISGIVKDLPEDVDKEKVSKFVKDNKLTPDQVKAYAALLKEEQETFQKTQAEFVKKQRADWTKELKTDPEFGGENFVLNVDRAEKVLEKYMPNMKKVLTERGSMLPPYIMKDLLSLSKALNPKTPLVTGAPVQPDEEGTNFLDDMYT